MLSNIPSLLALPSFGGVGGGSLSTLKKPTLLALPSLWEGLGVGFKGLGRPLSQLIHHTYRCKNGVEGLLNRLETAVMNAGQAPIQVEIAT